MRRRAHALGGEARIDSGPQGTIVAVHFPAPRGDAARPAEDRATGSVVALRPRAAALHPANAASPPRR
jgi:hypothetical protein